MRDGVTDFGIAWRPLLNVPAQHHLSRRLVVRLRDLADHRVLQRRGVRALAVERDATDGRPCLVEDAVFGVGSASTSDCLK